MNGRDALQRESTFISGSLAFHRRGKRCVERLVKYARRHETPILLATAAIFSAAAIQILSEFLEPSQPPAVAAVEMGGPQKALPTKADAVERAVRSSPRQPSTRSSEPAPAAPAPTASPIAPPGDDPDERAAGETEAGD